MSQGDLAFCLEFQDDIVSTDVFFERSNPSRVLLAVVTSKACSVWEMQHLEVPS